MRSNTTDIDWTDETLEYVDDDFSVSICGGLELGPFVLTAILIGDGENWLLPKVVTLENQTIGPARKLRIYQNPPPSGLDEVFAVAVGRKLETMRATIEAWAIETALERGLHHARAERAAEAASDLRRQERAA